MTDINSYAAPQSTPLPDSGQPYQFTEPQQVPVAHGWAWLSGGFELYKNSAVVWIVNIVIYMVIVSALFLVPVGGAIVSYLVWPILHAGLMFGCAAQMRGERLTVEHLFEGFRQKPLALAAIGALYLAATVAFFLLLSVIFNVVFGVEPSVFFEAFEGKTMPAQEWINQNFWASVMATLLALALILVLIMSIWFAPALVMLQSVNPLKAMWLSFTGCLRNFVPFTLYGVTAFALFCIATIPFLLGYLILFPTLTASVYVAYRDIFTRPV